MHFLSTCIQIINIIRIVSGWWGGGVLSSQVFSVQFSSVQLLSHVRLFATPWIAAHQASLSTTDSQSSPKLMCIESVMPSSHLILCRPLLLLPPIPPSIRVFSNVSTLCIRWPKYWSFSFSISLSKEHPGLISFRMDWLDLLVAQRTRKSLLQHLSSKASIIRRSAFFTVQLSHPHMTTGKTIALTRQTFVGKVMSLLLNMLFRLVITFLPSSKRLLILWLQSPSPHKNIKTKVFFKYFFFPYFCSLFLCSTIKQIPIWWWQFFAENRFMAPHCPWSQIQLWNTVCKVPQDLTPIHLSSHQECFVFILSVPQLPKALFKLWAFAPAVPSASVSSSLSD